jgi:hypothetical protein
MRTLMVALLVIVSPLLVSAQTTQHTQDPADLLVINYGWNKYVRPLDWDRPVFVDRARMQAESEQREERTHQQRAAERTGGGILTQNKPTLAADRRTQSANTQEIEVPSREDPSHQYIYTATVRNTGTKTIKAIAWSYVFLDPVDQKEISSRSFISKKEIPPGKDKKLTIPTSVPPTKVVAAGAKDKDGERRLTERVLIVGIQYSDGTSWQRPPDEPNR